MQRIILIALTLAGAVTPVQAQQIAVQQPVVRTTGVATTVSVPDRGTTFLGGVNSAESSRQSYGPLRTGTSRGYGLSAGSMSASVYIIDLQAMDEAILNSVPDSPVPVMRGRSTTARTIAEPAAVSAVEKAATFERLARQAESNGKNGLARLHWQMAARHGSALAQEKLTASRSEPVKAIADR